MSTCAVVLVLLGGGPKNRLWQRQVFAGLRFNRGNNGSHRGDQASVSSGYRSEVKGLSVFFLWVLALSWFVELVLEVIRQVLVDAAEQQPANTASPVEDLGS